MIPYELNANQKLAATHPGRNLLIAAGAGSGKTKTLTSRLAHLIERGEDPASIVAITFTNKAAREMGERVARLLSGKQTQGRRPYIGTFHAFGAGILRHEAERFGRTKNFTIFDDDDARDTAKASIKRFGLGKGAPGPALMVRFFSKLKGENIPPEELETGSYDRSLILELFEDYERSLEEMNAFDFDDLIQKTAQMLEHENARMRYREKFRHLLVDEFQDVNAAQYMLLRRLAGGGTVSVVGDDAQSIYRFRGSDFRNFLNFERDFADAAVVLLEENYRSSKVILDAANSLIANNKEQKKKSLWTLREGGDLVRVIEHEDAASEAEWIGDETGRLRNAAGESTVAVLYRTNAQSRELEEAMIYRGIPYRIFGGVRFYERREIKDLVSCLRFALNPKDEVSAARIKKNFLKKSANLLISELPEKGGALSAVELIGFVLKATDYAALLAKNYANSEERMENIAELIGFAERHPDLSEFAERISLLETGEEKNRVATEETARPPVNLMTIHAAKGLEFDSVFIAGANEGLLPHQMSYKEGDSGLEEERRLMYVAMTRAKKLLSLSFYDVGSRFLYEIPPECIEFVSFVRQAESMPDDDERYILLD